MSERLEAIRAMEDQAVLIAALADPAAVVVEAAARRVNRPAAAEPLVAAYWRLDQGGPASDKGCWGRAAIIEALGRIEAPEGVAGAVARRAVRTVQVEPVAGGEADTAIGLRVSAAALLANLRPAGALIDLAWLLHDFEPNARCSPQERPFAKAPTRAAAARAIGGLGEPAGAAVLGVKLAFPGAEVPEVLEECMDALVELAEPRTVELLTPWLAGPDPHLAAVAATGVARAGREAAIPLLVTALDRCPAAAREPLVCALASIRADATVGALRALTRHPDAVVRRVAASFLPPEEWDSGPRPRGRTGRRQG